MNELVILFCCEKIGKISRLSDDFAYSVLKLEKEQVFSAIKNLVYIQPQPKWALCSASYTEFLLSFQTVLSI